MAPGRLPGRVPFSVRRRLPNDRIPGLFDRYGFAHGTGASKSVGRFVVEPAMEKGGTVGEPRAEARSLFSGMEWWRSRSGQVMRN